MCDKSHNNAHTHALAKQFENFKVWCEAVAPLALSFKEPLTLEHFVWLYNTYGAVRLKQCAVELHNKEACHKNRRALTAWKSFIAKIV